MNKGPRAVSWKEYLDSEIFKFGREGKVMAVLVGDSQSRVREQIIGIEGSKTPAARVLDDSASWILK